MTTNERKALENSLTRVVIQIGQMDLGCRAALMVETVILCKRAVLEIHDGPEIPVRDNNVPATQLAKANRVCDRLRDALYEAECKFDAHIPFGFSDTKHIMLARQDRPRNSNWAIDRYDVEYEAWIRWSVDRLEDGHIWRYSVMRNVPERSDIAPSKALIEAAKGGQ